MSKIKNDGLDRYGPEPFEHQQFGTAGVEGVKLVNVIIKRGKCIGGNVANRYSGKKERY